MTAIVISYGGVGVMLAAMGAGTLALMGAAHRDPGAGPGGELVAWAETLGDVPVPQWPEPGTQTPCPDPRCGGRRCRGCEEPARNMADDIGWTARHVPEELPPSLVDRAMLWARPTDRAKLISREVRTRWQPVIVRNRVLSDMDGWTRRIGRVPQIGLARREVTLP